MKFAFKKANSPTASFFDKLIGWWESGPYAHVEAILAYDPQTQLYTTVSSVPGVGMRKTQMVLPASTWDIIDRLGILGFIVRPIKGFPTNLWFCSESVLESLGIGEPWRFDPNACYDVLVERQKLVS
jgi:hypothetical protein